MLAAGAVVPPQFAPQLRQMHELYNQIQKGLQATSAAPAGGEGDSSAASPGTEHHRLAGDTSMSDGEEEHDSEDDDGGFYDDSPTNAEDAIASASRPIPDPKRARTAAGMAAARGSSG